MPIVDHGKVIYPHDGAQALDPSRSLVIHEVFNEEALAFGLHESIVALSRASCRSTSGTERAGADAGDVVAAGALQFGQVDSGAVALVELVVQLVPRPLHLVEDVETPVNHVKVISVLIRTDVAHAHVATPAELQGAHIWVHILVVDEASRDLVRCQL